jgi:hypothetical protein
MVRPEAVVGKALLTIVVVYGAALAALAITTVLGPSLAGLLQNTRPCRWLSRRAGPDSDPSTSKAVAGGGFVHGFTSGFWLMLWLLFSAFCAVAIWHPTWHPIWSLLLSIPL